MFHYLFVFLYDVSLRFYWCGIFAVSFFNAKAKQWINGRKNQCSAATQLNLKEGKRYWFHCASLGEFEQARPLIEKLKAQSSTNKVQIILTFFSPSGYEVRKNYEYADVVMYLPLDTKTNARIFLDCVQPDVALFVKYEFWFHYLNGLNSRKTPVVLFASVFRHEQVFFKWYGSFFRNMLSCFTKIFVQNIASQKLLNSISVESEVCYDTRFDRVIQIAENRKSFPAIEKFASGSKIMVAGSTWKKDEALLLSCINHYWLREYKYIIAPHNIDAKELAELKKAAKVNARFISELTEENAGNTDVVIVDSIGQLSSLYAYAQIAYVGGGFNSSVHNILEAAVYGVPVLYGPNHQKSEEAKDLLSFSVLNEESFKDALNKIASNNELQATIGKNNSKYVEDRKGGTEQILRYLHSL